LYDPANSVEMSEVIITFNEFSRPLIEVNSSQSEIWLNGRLFYENKGSSPMYYWPSIDNNGNLAKRKEKVKCERDEFH
jgi:hypothetical protein